MPHSFSTPKFNLSCTKIANVLDQDGDLEIYTLDINGSDRVRLTDNHYLDFCPAWSPDGSKIVFESARKVNGNLLRNLWRETKYY